VTSLLTVRPRKWKYHIWENISQLADFGNDSAIKLSDHNVHYR